MHWPVMKLAASDASSTAAPISSSGCPKRPIGVRSFSSRPRSVPSRSCGVQVGAEDAGRDGVDVDAVARPFHGQAAGERQDRGFRCGIGGHFAGSATKEVSEAMLMMRPQPVSRQRPVERLAGAEHAREIHVHDAIPVGFGDFRGRLPLDLAGGIQQHVDAAELLQNRVAKAVDGLAGADVAGVAQRAAAGMFDLQAGFFDQWLRGVRWAPHRRPRRPDRRPVCGRGRRCRR